MKAFLVFGGLSGTIEISEIRPDIYLPLFPMVTANLHLAEITNYETSIKKLCFRYETMLDKNLAKYVCEGYK